ncbi:MAG: M20/M25/M40 family metallo-hydrolase [Caldiserica bacterium]|jgi:tripeptide aminopeptidase|nr:M20/M25/M40 family metallo-hydrolase [Caldisericota bacterium]MDH7562923.1 M20/M25/M40 family metallo-hydrolase [Caldisericota bacterium]
MNRERIIEEFVKQINIPSVSGNEEEFSQYLETRLKDLGLSVEKDSFGNIFAILPGNTTGKKPVLFCAHMDTVPTDPVKYYIDGDKIKANGSQILGADDKAATTALLEMLHSLKEEGVSHGDVEVLLTVQEEIGLIGAKNFDLGKARSQFFFVLDYSGPIGLAVYSAPFANEFHFRFFGKAAHAGSEPEKGISAIQALAMAISNMPLGRIDSETTANIGIISGGRATNIVADFAEMKGEARSRNPQKLEKQTQLMLQAAEEAAISVGARVEIDCRREYEGYTLKEDDDIILILKEALSSIGSSLKLVAAGGASDANVFNFKGRKSLVLSCGYEYPHTREEEVSISQMVDLSRLLKEIVLKA